MTARRILIEAEACPACGRDGGLHLSGGTVLDWKPCPTCHGKGDVWPGWAGQTLHKNRVDPDFGNWDDMLDALYAAQSRIG